jgi:hypothetical protein
VQPLHDVAGFAGAARAGWRRNLDSGVLLHRCGVGVCYCPVEPVVRWSVVPGHVCADPVSWPENLQGVLEA